MRLAQFDRDVMNVNQRVLRGIAAALGGMGMWKLADELTFIAQTLTPEPEKED